MTLTPAIVVDVETTGLNFKTDRIIEITIAWWRQDREPFVRRFNPGIKIDPMIEKLLGISNDDVKDLPFISPVLPRIKAWIEESDCFIGYNPFFDRGFLDATFDRAGIERPKWPMCLDAKRIWDVHEPKEKRNLMNAYKRFVHKDGFDGAHGSKADVDATIAVVERQIEEFNLHGKAWIDFDPERKFWWGPDDSVLLKDDVLIFNIGKNAGKKISEIQETFWGWLIQRDFSRHVLMMGLEAQRVHGRGLRGDDFDQALREWSIEFARTNFTDLTQAPQKGLK